MKKILRTALIIIFLGLMTGLIYMQLHQTTKTDAPEKSIYDLSFIDSQNKQYRLNDLRGKVAVINFWATYCGPCREEMPELSLISEAYQDQNVVILGISADELTQVQEFLEETKVSYRNIVAEFDAIDLSRTLGNSAGVLPFTVILDKKGHVLDSYAGRINSAKISASIDQALRLN